jgi:hypothetical protein
MSVKTALHQAKFECSHSCDLCQRSQESANPAGTLTNRPRERFVAEVARPGLSASLFLAFVEDLFVETCTDIFRLVRLGQEPEGFEGALSNLGRLVVVNVSTIGLETFQCYNMRLRSEAETPRRLSAFQ